MSLNKAMNAVTILGRVGAEPQRRGNEEHPVVTFSIATHNNYKYDALSLNFCSFVVNILYLNFSDMNLEIGLKKLTGIE